MATFIDLGIPALSTLTSFSDKYSDREVQRRKEVESYKHLVGGEDYYFCYKIRKVSGCSFSLFITKTFSDLVIKAVKQCMTT